MYVTQGHEVEYISIKAWNRGRHSIFELKRSVKVHAEQRQLDKLQVAQLQHHNTDPRSDCDDGWDEAEVVDSCTGLRMLLRCNIIWTWRNIKRVCVQLANGEGRWCYSNSGAKNARDFLVYGGICFT